MNNTPGKGSIRMKKGEFYIHKKVYEIVEVATCPNGGPEVVVYRDANYKPAGVYWRFATEFKRKFSIYHGY